MARKRQYKFGPKELPCGQGARLVIAYDGEFWDVAYYSLPEGEQFEERYATRKKILLDAFRLLFAEADEPYDADLLIKYIQDSPWGYNLRYLDRNVELPKTPQEEIAQLTLEEEAEKAYDPKTAEIPY